MKRLLLVLALPAVAAACGDANYYGEEFSLYYDKPAKETTSERIERREIVHWALNPKDKKRIGFLYKYETKVAGSRSYRQSWAIFDRLGTKQLGFITAEGEFYRFDANGHFSEKDKLGEWKVLPTGLKIFFGIPLSQNLDLEEVDPYK